MPMFGLADVNSFYASCEALFRPDLRGKPVVVLSNNDGCVIARSKAYLELGVICTDSVLFRGKGHAAKVIVRTAFSCRRSFGM